VAFDFHGQVSLVFLLVESALLMVIDVGDECLDWIFRVVLVWPVRVWFSPRPL